MPTRGRAIIAAGLLTLGAVFPAAAALPYAIKVWDTEEGLPQNTVTCLTTTRDGYLWLGTLNGLVRFDGLRFVVLDESTSPGLESSRITHLHADTAGGLWIGMESGALARWEQGRVTPQRLGRTAPERRLAGVGEDAAGALWCYTESGELWRLAGGQWTPHLFEWGQERGRRFLAAETNGVVWISAGRRLALLSAQQPAGTLEPRLEWETAVERVDYLLPSRRGGMWRLADGRVTRWRGVQREQDLGVYPWRSAPVTCASEDRLGNLVVGTLGLGVFWYRPDGSVAWVSRREGLSSDAVLSVQVDHEDNLWVGTDGGGLNRVRRQVFSVLENTAQLAVQSVCGDGGDGLWVGFNGSGVLRWTPAGGRFFGRNEGLPRMQVWSVLRDGRGRVWAGTYGGGLLQWRTNRFEPAPDWAGVPPVVTALFEDRRQVLWAGTPAGLARWEEGSLRLHTTNDGLSAAAVVALAEDREGALYAGTLGGGVNVLRDGRWQVMRKSAGGLPSDDIAFLHVDAEGVLWVGTQGSGLVRHAGGQWTRYTTREGLAGNGLAYLHEDAQGYFWIGSNAGLMRVARRALNDFAAGRLKFIPCRTYGKADGLPSSECTGGSQPAVGRLADGRLCFPTTRGLAVVNPAQLQPNTNPPPVRIEQVLVDGQAVEWPGAAAAPLTLKPARNRLEIHFTSLNLGAPERARFRYQLEPHEAEAVEAGNTRVARYPEVPPGRYRFVVTACNEDGVWNESGASLALVVLPPFWRTWWFGTVAGGGFLAALVLSVRYVSTQRLRRQVERLRQQEALEKERARIARDLHDQLGASLTQIALLGELAEADKAEPAEVAAHARQISQTARETTRGLDEIVWTVNPANDTLEGLANYLCKQAQDYLTVAGLSCRLEVPPSLPAVAIPPEVRHHLYMTAKEAVTNIVRHAGARSVWLRLHWDGGELRIEIADDGRGLGDVEEKLRTRHGLRNMRKRMAEAKGRLELAERAGGGTVVRMILPIRVA